MGPTSFPSSLLINIHQPGKPPKRSNRASQHTVGSVPCSPAAAASSSSPLRPLRRFGSLLPASNHRLADGLQRPGAPAPAPAKAHQGLAVLRGDLQAILAPHRRGSLHPRYGPCPCLPLCLSRAALLPSRSRFRPACSSHLQESAPVS